MAEMSPTERLKRGAWAGDEFRVGVFAVHPSDAYHRDEGIYVRSRQDCDDLIELLRVVRERLP
jgi:hypothetical protein